MARLKRNAVYCSVAVLSTVRKKIVLESKKRNAVYCSVAVLSTVRNKIVLETSLESKNILSQEKK